METVRKAQCSLHIFPGLFTGTHNLKIYLPKAPQLVHVERGLSGKDGLCSSPSGGMILAGRIPQQPSFSVFRDWFFGLQVSWALTWDGQVFIKKSWGQDSSC